MSKVPLEVKPRILEQQPLPLSEVYECPTMPYVLQKQHSVKILKRTESVLINIVETTMFDFSNYKSMSLCSGR